MAAKEDTRPDGAKFERDRLIADARPLTGHPSHVVAGALSTVRGEGPLTIARAKEAVDKFLNRAVRED